MVVVVAAMAVAGTALYLVSRDPPEALEQLERASRAGEAAADDSTRIARRLEELASNLEEGAGLSEASEEIRSLTGRQRSSLRAVVEILNGQLEALARSNEALEGSLSASTAVARLSADQNAVLRRTVAALRTLERAAAESGRFSRRVALQARYGARLAADSADNFSGP